MSASTVQEGTLSGGHPYLRLGDGDPLVVLRGFTPTHTNPRQGLQRSTELRILRPLAEHFTVYAVNRRPGLPEGTTMTDIAADHAVALADEFGGPTHVLGMSTGGSVALQLAVDHPGAVCRLVIAAAAYRLGPLSKQAQLRYGELVGSGRRGGHALAPVMVGSRIGQIAASPLMRLLDPAPDDPSDMLAVIHAEDAFDVEDRLGEITAPTLVIGGDRHLCYSTEMFRQTARGIPDARLLLYPRCGHGGTFIRRRFGSDVTGFLSS